MNPDEILAQLDGDTRAYLQILAQRGRRGVHGRPGEAVPAYPRTCARRSGGSSPPQRRRAKFTGCWPSGATERRRAIHSFSQLSQELGDEGHAARAARRVLERELPGVRRAGGEPVGARSSCCRPRSTTKQTRSARSRRLAASSAQLPGAAPVRAQPRPRAAPCARRCARPRRSSATRSGRSRASPAPVVKQLRRRPRTSHARPRT